MWLQPIAAITLGSLRVTMRIPTWRFCFFSHGDSMDFLRQLPYHSGVTRQQSYGTIRFDLPSEQLGINSEFPSPHISHSNPIRIRKITRHYHELADQTRTTIRFPILCEHHPSPSHSTSFNSRVEGKKKVQLK